MIINIRGISGSGKTYTMRKIMAGFPQTMVRFKRQIVGLRADREVGHRLDTGPRQAFVVGSYNKVMSGGCDAIKNMETLESLVSRYAGQGQDVLFEGIFVAGVHSRWIELARRNPDWDMRIIFLTTDYDTCVERVRQRRASKGIVRAWNMNNMLDFKARMVRQHAHFRRAGISIYDLSVDSCISTVRRWLLRP